MIVLLIIYLLVLISWLIWALILSYHLLKYKFPHDSAKIYLEVFWAVCLFVVVVSVIFAVKADWSTDQTLFKLFGA